MGRTNRQTDGQTAGRTISRVSMLTRDKNHPILMKLGTRLHYLELDDSQLANQIRKFSKFKMTNGRHFNKNLGILSDRK